MTERTYTAREVLGLADHIEMTEEQCDQLLVEIHEAMSEMYAAMSPEELAASRYDPEEVPEWVARPRPRLV
jgi:hypothetical protein